ncbi:O-methyltransferase [Pseudonocardia hydrocarbonoxydans]|uniref:O-methyltransferase n=1 Tax=Pseudonocardia hydrocarbonoxydans TaxID=76726 RepID=UPI001FEB8F60|nr:class I SAM-dependent methyltransferase [Pseudonocardia hydrocarbonoxydans]
MSAPRPVTPLGILVEKLGALVERAGDDPGLSGALREAHELAAGLDPYLARHTTPESPALQALAEATAARDWSRRDGPFLEREMLSGHVEGQFLKMLVHAVRARRVLDVGMFTGYSALAMAEALPADGRVVACEVDAEVAGFAARHLAGSGYADRIDVRVGPAADTLAALVADGEVFDLVFVDADKAGYPAYLAAVLDGGLLAPHGLVCVDNTLMQGQPWSGGRSDNGDAIAAFNDAVSADPRVEQVLVPLRDGVTLVRRVDRP